MKMIPKNFTALDFLLQKVDCKIPLAECPKRFEFWMRKIFRRLIATWAMAAIGWGLCISQTAFADTSNQATVTSSLTSSTESWDSQFNAYRAKKILFLTKLREYIETDHTDVQAFREKMGDLVEGDWKFCDEKKYCYLENKTTLFEYVTIHKLLEPHNKWESDLFIRMRRNQPFNDYHRDKGLPIECIRYDEFEKIFSVPPWQFVTIPPRINHHSNHPSHRAISLTTSNRGMRPQIIYTMYDRCINLLSVRFIQE